MSTRGSTSPPPSIAVEAWNELDDAVAIVDDALRPLLVNDAFRELTRTTGRVDQTVPRGYLALLANALCRESVERVERSLTRVLAREITDDVLVVDTRADSTHTEAVRVVVRRSRAYPGHAVIVHAVVTDQEHARREREAFELVADVAPDAIIVTDGRLRVLRWNRAAERTLGIPAAQALGRHVGGLIPGLDVASVADALVRERVFHDPPLTTEADVPQISAWGIAADDGHVPFVAAVILVRDNTPERRARFAAAQAHERLRQAQRLEAIGALAGGVAHDFNNLLSVIQSYANFVHDELPEGSPLADDVQEILGASQRGAALTRQLLAFGRRQVFEPKTTTLDEIVAELDRLLMRLIGEHISIVVEPGEETKPIRVDVAQIEQVIINLSLYARDAMPKGGTLTFRTRLVELDEQTAQREGALAGTYAELAVMDTSAGIDDAVLSRVFEPFFATKDAPHGTGLGLATAYGIVRQSGGHITAESTLGVGTTFRVRLPIATRAATLPKPRRLTPSSARPRPAFIVVVEDEPKVREIARRSLSARGYAVQTFATANDALPFLTAQEGPLDLLLTDLVMPGMSGAELAERVARARPQTRILFMTGYADDSAERLGVTLRGRDVLHKPFAPATLIARVRAALEVEQPSSLAEEVSQIRGTAPRGEGLTLPPTSERTKT